MNSDVKNMIITALKSFTKNEIIQIFLQNPDSEHHAKLMKETKEVLSQKAISLLTQKFSDLDELLLFIYIRRLETITQKRKWDVFKIKNAEAISKPILSHDDASKSVLNSYKKCGILCKAYSEEKENFFWIALHIGVSPTTVTYLLVHKSLSICFLSVLRKNISVHQEVLRNVFKGSEIIRLNSISENGQYFQHLDLKQFDVLNDESEQKSAPDVPLGLQDVSTVNSPQDFGIQSTGTEDTTLAYLSKPSASVDAPELCAGYACASKYSEDNNRAEAKDEDMDYIDDVQDQRKRKSPEKSFDNQNLPTIEKLTYRMKTSSFFGEGESSEKRSACIVTFRGKNVLKGLEEMVASGIADEPLPGYLYEEPRRTGKTEYFIRD